MAKNRLKLADDFGPYYHLHFQRQWNRFCDRNSEVWYNGLDIIRHIASCLLTVFGLGHLHCEVRVLSKSWRWFQVFSRWPWGHSQKSDNAHGNIFCGSGSSCFLWSWAWVHFFTYFVALGDWASGRHSYRNVCDHVHDPLSDYLCDNLQENFPPLCSLCLDHDYPWNFPRNFLPRIRCENDWKSVHSGFHPCFMSFPRNVLDPLPEYSDNHPQEQAWTAHVQSVQLLWYLRLIIIF